MAPADVGSPRFIFTYECQLQFRNSSPIDFNSDMMSLYWCKCAHVHTEIWPVNFLLNLNNQENDLMFLYDAKFFFPLLFMLLLMVINNDPLNITDFKVLILYFESKLTYFECRMEADNQTV